MTEGRIRGGRLDGFAQVRRMHREVPGVAPSQPPGAGAQAAVRTFAFSRDAPAAAREFTARVIDRLVTREPVQAAGAAVLRLAWAHRETLTG